MFQGWSLYRDGVLDTEEIPIRLSVFSGFLRDVAGISFWSYDDKINMVFSTSVHAEILDNFFSIGGCKNRVVEACVKLEKPAMIIDALVLAWIAVPHIVDGKTRRVFVIGPVFGSDASESNILQAIGGVAIGAGLKNELLGHLKELPVVQHNLFMNYGVMLYYYVTNQPIHASDIEHVVERQAVFKPTSSDIDRRYTYADELLRFKAVEEGNVAYKSARTAPPVGVMSTGDPVRQSKNMIITYVTLITRAAMRGGLPPEIAYNLSDHYIQMVEDETNVGAIYQFGQDAFQDFTRRVHKLKQATGRSREIERCLAYIELHLSVKINYQDMADALGYSRNYLSTKFHREMGMPMNEYITQQRLEQAKIWLRDTDRPIHEIAANLHFGSDSYFGQTFRKHVGVSPSVFRENRGNI